MWGYLTLTFDLENLRTDVNVQVFASVGQSLILFVSFNFPTTVPYISPFCDLHIISNIFI